MNSFIFIKYKRSYRFNKGSTELTYFEMNNDTPIQFEEQEQSVLYGGVLTDNIVADKIIRVKQTPLKLIIFLDDAILDYLNADIVSVEVFGADSASAKLVENINYYLKNKTSLKKSDLEEISREQILLNIHDLEKEQLYGEKDSFWG